MRIARILLAALAPAVAISSAAAQAGLATAPSTRATVAVSITQPRQAGAPAPAPLGIRIDYGQPHLRGRTLHTGGLVPLDSVWRTGANEATAFETDVDLMMGGAIIPKGKYTLFTLPSRSGWKLIINRNTGQWGTQYDAAHDLARIDLTVRTLHEPVEALSITLVPDAAPSPPKGQLRITWGTVELTADWAMR